MRPGNSLAYLLCQEAKATADVRVVSYARTQMRPGNSLAYLLSQEVLRQEQKCATADVRVVSLPKSEPAEISTGWRSAA